MHRTFCAGVFKKAKRSLADESFVFLPEEIMIHLPFSGVRDAHLQNGYSLHLGHLACCYLTKRTKNLLNN